MPYSVLKLWSCQVLLSYSILNSVGWEEETLSKNIQNSSCMHVRREVFKDKFKENFSTGDTERQHTRILFTF